MPNATRPDDIALETAPSGDARRRVPTQERSRARLARILACAEALIAEKGSDRLRMAEVADAAGISIGSLYQYFPDKSAIIHALAAGYNAACRETIVAALRDVADVPDFVAAFTQLMHEFYALVRHSPVIRDIWAGMQADRTLAALQLEESRAMGALLAATVARVRPSLDRGHLDVTSFLLWDLGDATVRLAIASDEQRGAEMVATYTRMAVRELTSV
jgi:AcrR family transcriptional regulator